MVKLAFIFSALTDPMLSGPILLLQYLYAKILKLVALSWVFSKSVHNPLSDDANPKPATSTLTFFLLSRYPEVVIGKQIGCTPSLKEISSWVSINATS